METKLTTLKPFFENPGRGFYIRELARLLKINHTTVRQRLNRLVKEGYLTIDDTGLYKSYRLVVSKQMLNLKLYHNLEKLRLSGIIEDLNTAFDFPVIVLFGSYSTASDDESSDIDLCIITNINKDFDVKKYEKVLGRKITFHKFTKKAWEGSKKRNKELINNICNGIVLSGEMEVL